WGKTVDAVRQDHAIGERPVENPERDSEYEAVVHRVPVDCRRLGVVDARLDQRPWWRHDKREVIVIAARSLRAVRGGLIHRAERRLKARSEEHTSELQSR